MENRMIIDELLVCYQMLVSLAQKQLKEKGLPSLHHRFDDAYNNFIAANPTPDDDAKQGDDTTKPVQDDEQVAEPDQLYCTCKNCGIRQKRFTNVCIFCWEPLAG